MRSGRAAMADAQSIRGYRLLLLDPVVGSVNDSGGEGPYRACQNADTAKHSECELALTTGQRRAPADARH
jgi:hypothetical protein